MARLKPGQYGPDGKLKDNPEYETPEKIRENARKITGSTNKKSTSKRRYAGEKREVTVTPVTDQERLKAIFAAEKESIKTEFARANLRGDIRLNEAGQFEARTRQGQKVLSQALAVDKRTVELAQQQAAQEAKVKEFNIRETEQFKGVERVNDLIRQNALDRRPQPPLNAKQEKLRQSINKAAEREKKFNERVKNTRETFTNILDMNTDDLINFKGEKLFKNKKASETFVGELFTQFATGVNPLVLGGAIAQAGEKTKLAIQALLAGQKKEVIQETIFTTPKQVLPVFDVRTRQGQITFTIAAIGATIPAAAKVSKPKVTLEGTIADTRRVANTEGGFFEVTKIDTTAKVGKKTITVEGGSVISGQKSPVIDDVTAFFGNQAIKTSKGTEAGSEIIGITENKGGGISESIIGTETTTNKGTVTETATAAKTQTITDAQGLQTSRSVITDFEVFGDTFKPSRVGVSGSEEIIRINANDLTFSQFKSAEAAVSGKGGVNAFKDFLNIEKGRQGVLNEAPSGTTKTITSGETPSVAKLNLESTIKQVVASEAKPGSAKPAPVVVQNNKNLLVEKPVQPGTTTGKTTNTHKVATSPVTIQDVSQSLNQGQISGQDKIVKRDVGQSQISLEDTIQEQKPAQDQRIIQEAAQSQTPREAVIQIQQPVTIQEPIQTTSPLTQLTDLTTPKPPKGGFLTLDLLKGRLAEPASFQVFVKEKGSFKQVKGNLTKGEAINLGANIARTSSVASFKVLKQGQPVKVSVFDSLLKGQFGTAKKNQNVLVEKNKYRIDTPGELEEITFKGLRALKFKSGLLK
jgi:hypothetical protein